jgi:hypothetical protein
MFEAESLYEYKIVRKLWFDSPASSQESSGEYSAEHSASVTAEALVKG